MTLSDAVAAVSDPAIVDDVVKAAGTGLALFLTFVWAEIRRARAAKEHATVQANQTAEQEAKRQERRERDRRLYEQALDYRFGEVHRQLQDHRDGTERSLQKMALELTEIGVTVGATSENGLKGGMKKLEAAVERLDTRFNEFQRDQLHAARNQ